MDEIDDRRDSHRRARRSHVARGRFAQALLAANGGAWPDFESVIEAIYTAFVRPGDVVLDAGVNRGTHLFPLAECVGPHGRVIGIEAVPAFVAAVRAELDGPRRHLRDRIELHACAVAERAGIADFFVTSITDGGLNGLRLRPVIAHAAHDCIVVPVATIDRLAGDAPIRFAKLDIEGGEYHALQGANSMLRRRPLIVFEFDEQTPAQFGFAADDLLALLRHHGYRTYDIAGFEVLDGERMRRARFWNFVAVPDSVTAAIVLAPAQRRLAELVPPVASLLPAL